MVPKIMSGLCKLQKRVLSTLNGSDSVYQLLAQGWCSSSGIPASSTTISLYNLVTDNFKEYDFGTEYCLNIYISRLYCAFSNKENIEY